MKPNRTQPLSTREKIDVLLAEYRSLNQLLRFRLSALDRRLPISAGFTTAAVAAMLALPDESRLAVLIATPSALMWLVRTSVQHACAKEDHLRRIAEIEENINRLANDDLLLFQSRHPNLASAVSGRSGTATVRAIALGSALMVFLCVVLFLQSASTFPVSLYATYAAYILGDIIIGPIRLARYRYQRPPPTLIKPESPELQSHS